MFNISLLQTVKAATAFLIHIPSAVDYKPDQMRNITIDIVLR